MSIAVDKISVLNESTSLGAFCRDRLSPLARSDQRRWGEVYVRGLVTVPGRKSIRRICDTVVGTRVDQCLQQFVNQSTWQWEPVRRNLAEHVTEAIAPRAWVVRDAVFPKNGANSVGVDSRYVPAAGRTLNCQVGLAVMLAGGSVGVPVNWRLLLPRSWDADERRRGRAHVPAAQRHRPRWQVMLEAVEEMRQNWGLAPAPVLADVSDQQDVEPLLWALEERGLGYLLRVGQHVPVPPARASSGRACTVGELAVLAVRPAARTLNWQIRTAARASASRFVASPVSRDAEPSRYGNVRVARRHQPARHLLAQWTVGRNRPKATWLTNLNVARLPQLIDLVGLDSLAAEHLGRMQDDVGLRHFEGRSYRGWHHHVTLASLAYAYRLGSELRESREDLAMRPYA
ncbi:IS701 family transposase [Amycolatopsis sp. FU40]|uniref:IS701 family transposase n=1 Tax=Amycolatopsis sp. FU40 TaxID=2914159 RepID=UPI001EFFABFC|nr:IS701 family transposase [Amycolatopsis sp. FU40]UKD58640.1 IS701 family transposase [Amycolatopsis sp. FU40]